MRGSRFDHLAQTLAMAGTRRGVLRLLVARFLAGGLALLGGDGTSLAKPQRISRQRVGGENHNHPGRRRKHRNRQRKDRRHDRRRNKADCCGADGSCGACLVFVTSTTHNGNLGGLAGADAICQTRAAAATLPGTYKAWLSDGTGNSPASRFRRSDLGYRRVDGTTVADNWADLTDGTLDVPINVTESGGPVGVGDHNTWTHTQTNGAAGSPTNQHCHNWTTAASSSGQTGAIGLNTASDARWTFHDAISCDSQSHLYCFQQR